MPRRCSSLLLSLLIASSASAVTMAWTPIGNPGNPGDPQTNCTTCPAGTTFGAVPYAYSIGTYEVTNAQYAEFLNAKASSDPLGLYNTSMGSASGGSHGGITRSGSSGNYIYSTIAGRENMPVNYVAWFDALRFANWMSNGQGAGSTETGAYTLLGGTLTPSNGTTVTRNASATIALASENEWYKAAYYDPTSGNYFDYPAGSNTQTFCVAPVAIPNSANCYHGGTPDLAIRGGYTLSASPYGTFD
jgi:formylglycine-generating enzyme